MKNTEIPFPGGPRSPSARTAGSGEIKDVAGGSQRAAGRNTRNRGRENSFRSHKGHRFLQDLSFILIKKNQIGYPFFSAEVGTAGTAFGSPAKRARRIFLRRERVKATFPGRARAE